MFETSIGIDANRICKITVHELDDVTDIAVKFSDHNFLNQAKQNMLLKHLKRHVERFYSKRGHKPPSKEKLLQYKAFEPSLLVATVMPAYQRFNRKMSSKQIEWFHIGDSANGQDERVKINKTAMLHEIDAAYEPINEVRDSRIYTSEWKDPEEDKPVPKFLWTPVEQRLIKKNSDETIEQVDKADDGCCESDNSELSEEEEKLGSVPHYQLPINNYRRQQPSALAA